MNFKFLIKVFVCLFLCVNLIANSASQSNILFIMSDDHAAHAIGAYGGRLASLNPTPTLDKLAKEGTIMENTFCNNAVCTPSRVSILTGQYSHVNGAKNLGAKLEEDHQYLAIEMRKAGYQTAVVGKWHIGVQPKAFDYYKVLHSQGKYHDPEFFERISPEVEEVKKKEEGFASDLVVDSAITWLKKRDKTKPFLLLNHFKAPHGPFEPAERYMNLYEDVKIPEPASLWDNQNNGSIATRGENDELVKFIGSSVGDRNIFRSHGGKIKKQEREQYKKLSGRQKTSFAYQHYLKNYLRCVRGVDDNIKRLLDYLQQEGELDNTIIIYTSDQGMMLGEHDYIDKRWIYEESLRMPFIIRYPKAIKADTKSDALISNVDFAPTLMDYAGIARPKYMQGHSFRSIMESGEIPENWRKATYYRYWMHMKHHYNPAHFGLRTQQYKLVFFYGASEKEGSFEQTPPGWELYDIKADPKEMNNLYSNPEYKSVVQELKKQLKALRLELNDTDVDYPHIQKVVEDFWDGGEEDAVTISNKLKNSLQERAKTNAKKRGE
jgi:arylsulfatase A-like enzyme